MEVVPRTLGIGETPPKTELPLIVRESLQLPKEVVPFSKRQAGMLFFAFNI
jgi:hypothetical protein